MESSSEGSNSANMDNIQDLKGKVPSVGTSKEVIVDDPTALPFDNDILGSTLYGGWESFKVECDEGDDIEMEDDKQEDNEEQERTAKKRKGIIPSRSSAWIHFEKFIDPIDNVQKGKCKFCSRVLKAGSKKHGTNSLKKHLEICKRKPCAVASNQAHIVLKPTCGGDKEAQLLNWQFDQEQARKSLCRMLVLDELPFKTVENEGFQKLIFDICPMFVIPSRRTVTRDIYNMWASQKVEVISFTKRNAQRICLTIDNWTSVQRVNYMCLTVHFIDADWKLQKKILNFCPITGHKSEELGKALEKCLLDWGITGVFSVMDNASSNDGAIAYLIKQLDKNGTNILGGKYVHMSCAAHILNLIVQDGLKKEECVISRVRNVIRYIKNSPMRYKRFKECVKEANIDSDKLLILDVPTRWNSTYIMLEHAFTLRRAFDVYADVDVYYLSEISKSPFEGHLSERDWERIQLLLKILEHFYDVTLAISGSKHITFNALFHQISDIEMLLWQWLESDDFELKEMSKRMKENFDKYWGPSYNLNMIAYYAIILDPQWKLVFLEHAFDTLYGDVYGDFEKVAMLKEKVRNGIKELYSAYKKMYDPPIEKVNTSSQSTRISQLGNSNTKNTNDASTLLIRNFIADRTSEQSKSELERYLNEENEVYKEDFDILGWWKINCHRFPVLSKIARDIFAIPVSTVTSESTFSIGGRVLDAFRSSLTPTIVETLICLQDWLCVEDRSMNVEEDLKDLESLESEFSKIGVQ